MNPRSIRFRLIIWYAGLLTGAFLVFALPSTRSCKAIWKAAWCSRFSPLRSDRCIALERHRQDRGALRGGSDCESLYAGELRSVHPRYPPGWKRALRLRRTLSFDPSKLPPLKAGAVHGDFVQKEMMEDGNRLMVTVKVVQADKGRRFLIESGGPMSPIETTLSHMRIWLLLGVPLLGLVAVGGGFILVGRALAPVERIANSAEQITLHNLSERLSLTNTGDELEHLSLALNRMIARLSEAIEQNRRFLADASHELRTPLAALRGELESVVEQARALPELSDRVGSALEEVDRLAKIVDALFAISRLDAGEAQQEQARFDLASLAASTTEQMSLLAEDKGVSVACNVQGSVHVDGDRARIKQVVVNLLDNAIKYTPPGGSIKLDVSAREDKAVIEVADTGIGIPPTLCRIFSSAFSAWTRRVRAMRAGPGWDWPSLNPFARPTAAKCKWKAAKARAAVSKWNCRSPGQDKD